MDPEKKQRDHAYIWGKIISGKGSGKCQILKQEGACTYFEVNLIKFVDGLDAACRKASHE